MRRFALLLTLSLVALGLVATPVARAQDPAPPAVPEADAPSAERAYEAATKRLAGVRAAIEHAERVVEGLDNRRVELVKARDRIAKAVSELRERYESDDSRPLTTSQVRERIRAEKRDLATERTATVIEERSKVRVEVEELVADADERNEGLARRYAGWRAEALAAIKQAGGEDAAWDAELVRWTTLRDEHGTAIVDLLNASGQAKRLSSECDALHDEIRGLRETTIQVLQANNLTLRGESRITADAVSKGLRDVSLLPAWFAQTGRDAWEFATSPKRRPANLGFLAAAFALVGALLFARRRIRMHLRDAGELDTDRERAIDLGLRLASATLFAVALAAVPLAASELLEGLPDGVPEALRVIGWVLGGAWFVRSLTRRLLPATGRWSPVTLDLRTTALIRTGLQILLFLTVVLVPVAQMLRVLGYSNDGAIEALWALYELGFVLTLLVFLFRRDVVLQILPSSEGTAGRVLRRIVGALHPVLMLVGPVVLVLDLLSYELLAEFLTRLVGGTVVALVAGFVVHGALWRGLEAWLKTVVTAGRSGETESSQLEAASTISRYLLRIAVLVGAVFLMLLLQGGDFATLSSFLDVDLPFQAKVEGHHITWWNVLTAAVLLGLFLTAVGKAKLFLERFILPRTSLDTGLRYTISTLVGYVIAALGIYVGLMQVFDLGALAHVFTALSVGIGFGLQEIVSNFVSGLILLFERPLKVGDLVTVGGTEGWVTKINIRATTIQTRDNVSMLIPNKDFITQAVVNSDYGEPIIRLRVGVGVAYGSDTALVKRVLEEVARAHPRTMGARSVDVLFKDFGESSLDFELRLWIPEATEHPSIASDLRYAIDAAFRANGVEIPFPQRDLHVRSVDAAAAERLRGGDPAPEDPAPEEAAPEDAVPEDAEE